MALDAVLEADLPHPLVLRPLHQRKHLITDESILKQYRGFVSSILVVWVMKLVHSVILNDER